MKQQIYFQYVFKTLEISRKQVLGETHLEFNSIKISDQIYRTRANESPSQLLASPLDYHAERQFLYVLF